MVPNFVEDMIDLSFTETAKQFVIGKFHLGQIYNLETIKEIAKLTNPDFTTYYEIQEQSELNASTFTNKILVISGFTLLVFEQLPYDEFDLESRNYGILESWASLHSISRVKKPAPLMVSIIFKLHEDKQPWIFNFIVLQNQEDDLISCLKIKLSIVTASQK